MILFIVLDYSGCRRSNVRPTPNGLARFARLRPTENPPHACDFIHNRVAPAEPVNDGKQTPMRGHPVFIAQHATAICCHSCIEKWHKFPKGRELTQTEQEYLVSVIMEWIKRQINTTQI